MIDHRDLPAGEDEEQRDAPASTSITSGKVATVQSEQRERGGQAAEVDEEPGAHGREDAEVDDAGDEGQQAGEDAEAPAVAHLEELGHGQRSGSARKR